MHHIIEITQSNIDDWYITLGPANLQSLCWDCHNKITRGISDVPDGYRFSEDGQVVPHG